MGTPLVSSSECSQKVPVFFIGGGKPIFTQSQSDKEGQSPSDIEKQIPLPLNIGNLSYIGNTENTELIIHSNIVIKDLIVEVDDRMEQPLGPSEVVKTAEEGDTVLSKSTETLINNTKSLASDESQINVVQPSISSAQIVANNAFENQESSVSSASESNFREFLVPSTSSERRYRRTSRIERVTIRDSAKGKAEQRKRLSPDIQEVKRLQRDVRKSLEKAKTLNQLKRKKIATAAEVLTSSNVFITPMVLTSNENLPFSTNNNIVSQNDSIEINVKSRKLQNIKNSSEFKHHISSDESGISLHDTSTNDKDVSGEENRDSTVPLNDPD
ncbi:hypothetical protein JTB14_036894 [Gonioctena quinquepunctata]|nr:hypothetical protein JTB14_036894 [Gonioctena quinquepunctata]